MEKPTIEELKAFDAYHKPDTVFAAWARVLQSKWRSKPREGNPSGYPAGKLGNYLDTTFATQSRANFLTIEIADLVSKTVAEAREHGAMIGQPRIWDNLLSSQPLCFNLFGALSLNLDKATAFFRGLFPGLIGTVTAIRFEYSPGRGDLGFTGDHSAFDAFVEYERSGRRGFLGIEVKYAERLREEERQKSKSIYEQHEARYRQLSHPSNGVFRNEVIEDLRWPPLSQIWRDHLLAISMLAHEKPSFDEGRFVFLFPALNVQCQEGVNEYLLRLASMDESLTLFSPRHLEDFVSMLNQTIPEKWTNELKERYLGS